MPRVLVFKERLLPPSETFILAQAGALRRYQPSFAGLEPSVPTLSVPKPLLLTNTSGRLADMRAKVYRRTGFAPRFHQAARRLNADLVHAHFGSGGVSAMPLASKLRKPLLVTLHGADITVRGARERYAKLGKVVSQVLCVSQYIRDQALDAGFPPSKLVLHYIGIDRSLFQPSSQRPAGRNVLFVGRLVEKKGCEYLIRAMQSVQQHYPEAGLTVIGDGPLRLSLERLAKELKVDSRFLGVLPAPEVKEQLRQAYLFCVPSIQAVNGDSEGFGMVFAEAQAMGVPVVSTLHGGIPEVVHNNGTGLLVPERDSQALAAALRRLLQDDDLHQQFRQAAMRRVAEHFDLARQTVLLEEIYDRALADG